MSAYPIPSEALDDRLAWTGMSGTGKTYDSGTAIERVLHAKSRVCIGDPLGVWWGLRLRQDGKTASKFKVVIFGGPHGDIGITETSGKVIGEAVAGMAESCILDLSEFDTEAGQRRFMLAFLVALYAKHSGDLLHVVLDEADMWAPQRIMDKEGDATKLHHNVQKLVRRGRARGFIPWLITQRPAELSKSVLSQADGIVAHQLAAPQDVSAIMDWVSPRADEATAKMIRTEMPAFARGEAVVYIPRRRHLQVGRFPQKVTFDSSRAPERGEKANRPDVQLKPLDIAGLQKRLEKVDADAKANDPDRLKRRIAELEREARGHQGAAPAKAASNLQALGQAEGVGYRRGKIQGYAAAIADIGGMLDGVEASAGALREQLQALDGGLKRAKQWRARGAPKSLGAPANVPQSPSARADEPKAIPPPAAKPAGGDPGGALPPSRQKIVDALAWLETIGQDAPKRNLVAFVAGVSPKSSGFEKYVSELRTGGFVDYPEGGCLALTAAGQAIASVPAAPLTHEAVMGLLRQQFMPSVMRLLDAALGFYPASVTRADLAAAAGVSASSSGFEKYVSQLSSFGLVTYPAKGEVRASDMLFPEGRQ